MTEARRLFDDRPRSAAAKRLRIVEGAVPEAPKATGPNAVRLVRDGWDFKERLGKRIWSHEEITGGFWVSEETAMQRNDERKG